MKKHKEHDHNNSNGEKSKYFGNYEEMTCDDKECHETKCHCQCDNCDIKKCQCECEECDCNAKPKGHCCD